MKIAEYDRYFLKLDLCALAFSAWAIIWLVRGEEDWLTLLNAVWLVGLLILFSRERRDEFAEHCWRRATSATFGMLLAAPILVSFGAGVISGFTSEALGNSGTLVVEQSKDFEPSLDLLMLLCFGTFFSSFEWTRFRGGTA